MIDVSQVPPELMQQVRSMFVALFGGKAKLDCWLNKIADELANPENPANRPIKFDLSVAPQEFQSLMDRPKEVIDVILEKIDAISLFGYTAKIVTQGEVSLALVSDQASGHIIEEAAGPEPDSLIRSLVEKYGQNLEVEKE